jgi:2-iminobutanoate/2-iminopropanoate deaminase
MRNIIYTSNAAKPPPAYSQAVKAAGLVFVSGTAPADPETGQIVGTTIQEQTRQCLTNISAILEAAGSSMNDIVSATVVLADEDDFAGMNEEWVRWFPSNPPARQGAPQSPSHKHRARENKEASPAQRGFLERNERYV